MYGHCHGVATTRIFTKFRGFVSYKITKDYKMYLLSLILLDFIQYEGVFSSAGQTMSPRRTTLNGKNLSKLVFINRNVDIPPISDQL